MRPATAANRFRSLQAFFKWLVVRFYSCKRSPMEKMKSPTVPEEPPPVITDDELRRLLHAARAETSTLGETLLLLGCYWTPV